MKIFKLMAVALVAMLGFTACDNDPEHIYDDHSADFVGTWTCHNADLAEALIINADGSVLSTGSIFGEEYWENVKGNIVFENGDITMTFEDGDIYKGHFDIIPGVAFSVYNDKGRRFTYNYCANDLSDEIVGMWVCNDSKGETVNDMLIQTFNANGITSLTGFLPIGDNNEYILNDEAEYKVVGDLMFLVAPADKVGGDKPKYIAERLIYTPNATAHGDIMTFSFFLPMGNNIVSSSESWLRIKQNLDLAGKAYDYNNTYVSNVKGLDEDMTMMGYTFNIGKMEGKNLDKMLKTLLFAVEFPNANTLKYQYHYNGQNIAFEARIVVDGNKVTIKMSEMLPYYRDVDMYMFQDQNNTQLHMYMPTYSFINYFGNMDVAALAYAGEIDVTDAAAVEAIFDRMDERVESINLSIVCKNTTTRAL